jgi:hypothetical protein
MPLKLNVGLSRKVGDANYGSRGASVNFETELDSSLAGDPAKLQQRIRDLFNLCRSAISEELNGGNGHFQQPVVQNGNGHQRPNHAINDSQQPPVERPAQPANGSSKLRLATVSQIRAIRGICGRRRLNLDQMLTARFHVRRPEELTLRDASDLIDELKGEGGT